jgi:UDP-glucose 4-epimerase
MKDLDSYLNHHFAGSVGALELIDHCAHLYEGKPLGAFFSEMEAQIGADQDTLRDLMCLLGIEESKARQAGAWAGEKFGRALFTLAGNEPDGLGLLLVLEGLIMAVAGKRLLWRALSAANLPKLEQFDFEELQRRAEEQIKCAEAEQVRSARRALMDKKSLAT